MRRLWHPVTLYGVVYRVQQGPSEQFIVEEWTGSYWTPSLRPLHSLGAGQMTDVGRLASSGIPASDWADLPRWGWKTPELKPMRWPAAPNECESP